MDADQSLTQQIEFVRQNLHSTKTVVRRKAAHEIAKNHYHSLGDELLTAFLLEQQDVRTWETQVAMLRALGEINHTDALPSVSLICQQNKSFDEITRAAATTYVRLQRKNLNDADAVVALLQTGNYAVTMGALDALGYDRMLPASDQIATILNIVDAKAFDLPKGVGDPRYGLAAAAAGWDKTLTGDFLNACLQSTDVPLRYVTENSLKGKYVKLR